MAWILRTNLKGPAGNRGVQGLPGISSALPDSAVASYLTSESQSRVALEKVTEAVFTPQMFGAIGDGVANDTVAVQAAVDAALAATNPVNWFAGHAYVAGQTSRVHFPMGTYSVNEIQVNGTVKLTGVGGYIYTASVIRQRSAGQNIFLFGSDTDGQTNSTVIEDLTFKSGSGTSDPNVAQLKTTLDVKYASSFYIRNCWFMTPERYAIWFTQGGDIEIEGCTFDVAGFGMIKLGISGLGPDGLVHRVEASRINNNTFAMATNSCIELSNATGITITGNRLINSAGSTPTTAVFINANNDSIGAAASVARFAATGNTVERVYGFASLTATGTLTDAQAAVITGNFIHNAYGHILRIVGTGIYYGLNFTGNTVKSASDSFAEGSAFSAISTGVQASVISHNSVMAGATTPLLFDISKGSLAVSNNIFNSNVSINFTANNNFNSPSTNGAV